MDPQTPVTPNPLPGPDPMQPQPGQSFQPSVVTPDTPMAAEDVSSDIDLPIQPAAEAPAAMPPTEPAFPATPMPEPAAPVPAQPAVPDMQPQPAQSYVPNVDVTVKPAEPVQPASMPAFMNPNPGETPQQGGLPQPGMRGEQPPVMVNVVNKKSKLPLIIAILLVLVLLGGGAAYALTRKKSSTSTNSGSNNSSSSSSNSNSASKSEDTTQKVSTVAKYSSDFDEVCKGGAISNAADYTSNKTAIISSFHSSVITKDSWTFDSVGYGKSYYLTNVDDFAKISVVACAKYVDGSAKTGKSCEYQSNGATVTIDYQSTEYELTFYEAKTGKKISDGGKISGPASTCPSSVLYDQSTKKAYADPDDNALEAAFDTFVK